VEGGRLNVGRRGGSSWWREFAKIRDGDGGVSGRWLDECISKKVGDGIETYFWRDHGDVGGSSLRVRFKLHFDLAKNKSGSMVVCVI
jgi:hypothetical protein